MGIDCERQRAAVVDGYYEDYAATAKAKVAVSEVSSHAVHRRIDDERVANASTAAMFVDRAAARAT